MNTIDPLPPSPRVVVTGGSVRGKPFDAEDSKNNLHHFTITGNTIIPRPPPEPQSSTGPSAGDHPSAPWSLTRRVLSRLRATVHALRGHTVIQGMTSIHTARIFTTAPIHVEHPAAVIGGTIQTFESEAITHNSTGLVANNVFETCHRDPARGTTYTAPDRDGNLQRHILIPPPATPAPQPPEEP